LLKVIFCYSFCFNHKRCEHLFLIEEFQFDNWGYFGIRVYIKGGGVVSSAP